MSSHNGLTFAVFPGQARCTSPRRGDDSPAVPKYAETPRPRVTSPPASRHDGGNQCEGAWVIDVSADEYADEYPAPPRLVGRGAVFVEHRLRAPQVSESAYVAPTAVLARDVTIRPHTRVLFGAVITAEGGPVRIGSNCVVMENAVIRGAPNQETRVGDEVLVGPQAHLTGCVIEGGSRIATGAVVFNGARIGTGAELEFHAVVFVNTVVPSGVAVPLG